MRVFALELRAAGERCVRTMYFLRAALSSSSCSNTSSNALPMITIGRPRTKMPHIIQMEATKRPSDVTG